MLLLTEALVCVLLYGIHVWAQPGLCGTVTLCRLEQGPPARGALLPAYWDRVVGSAPPLAKVIM